MALHEYEMFSTVISFFRAVKNRSASILMLLAAVTAFACVASEGDDSMKDEQKANAETQKGDVGFRAPDFTLPDQEGKPVSLNDFLGKNVVVLYFYPKDNTSVCTAQACSFRDSFEDFKDAGATVIGISSDSVETHAGFAGKHRLPFHLLSDEGGEVRKRYGATTMLGVPGRVTFVIDKEGVVRHKFSAMFSADKHIKEAMKIVDHLNE